MENKVISDELMMKYMEAGLIDRRIPAKDGSAAFNKALTATTLPLICIYDHPTDYPENYIARIWDKNEPTNTVVLADTLEELQSLKPEWMAIIPRQATDDPVIVETWI